MTTIEQGRDLEVFDRLHAVGLHLGRSLGFRQHGVAGFQASATTGDLQQELSSAVVLEAEVLIAQCLNDVVT